MAKEPKPVDKLTKPELLALVKRLHKRIVRLEAELGRRDGVLNKPANEPAEVAWQDANQDAVARGELFPWEAK